ncbi:MAG: hypothetical protein K0S18_152 [Anaerocolumna sp.]|jgi:hypothetical protein|nr:hypothetical protein [Anaerocolumna sp.]
MNRNYTTNLDLNYKKQQQVIKEICNELNLVVFYPDYHADKKDNNTVMIYTHESNEYNNKLPKDANNDQYKDYVCFLENTDLNGMFSLSYMNHGKIDLRGYNTEKEKIKDFISQKLEEYNNK